MVHQATPRQPGGTHGITRSYTRMRRGIRQQVHQYQNHRLVHPAHPAPKDTRIDWGKIPTTRTSWRDLNKGDVVDFGGEPWKVLETYVNGPSTAGTKTSHIKGKAGKASAKGTSSGKKTGSGVNPGGPMKTASQGKGVNTGGASKASSGTSTFPVTDMLENLYTGRRINVTLSPGFAVWVY